MREVLEQLEGLLQFQGLHFRSATVICPHCGWKGTGGALEVPALAASGEPVVYACPDCMEAVAIHNGLTDQEVTQEMEKIRQILAAEMALATAAEHNPVESRYTRPDFAAIRAQLPTEEHVATAAESTKAAKPCKPATVNRDEAPELDFAAIRARLGVPA